MPISPQQPVSIKLNVRITGYEVVNFTDERIRSIDSLITQLS